MKPYIKRCSRKTFFRECSQKLFLKSCFQKWFLKSVFQKYFSKCVFVNLFFKSFFAYSNFKTDMACLNYAVPICHHRKCILRLVKSFLKSLRAAKFHSINRFQDSLSLSLPEVPINKGYYERYSQKHSMKTVFKRRYQIYF